MITDGEILGRVGRLGPALVALAPMSGVTDRAFRRSAMRYGAAFAVTEMVPAEGLVRRSEEARLRAEGSDLRPHVVQIVGRNPAAMADAARLAEGSGADVVDINMGCPTKSVTGGLAGSALMREPALALAIVGAVVRAVRCPVTVKMRLGWDEDSRNAAELAAQATELGATRFAVHGRTRSQFYKGSADWAAIGRVVDATSRPVVANGDVSCATSARRCLLQSRAAGVMIGRGALGQPWLPGEAAAELAGAPRRRPSLHERMEIACEHYDALLRTLGREVGRRHARKHLAAYADRAAEAGFGLPGPERAELVTTEEPRRALFLLRRLYSEPQRLAA